jgi:uncharacterized protein
MSDMTRRSAPVYEEIVTPGNGTGGRIEKGQILRITDLEGKQVADFCSFMADDPTIHCDVSDSTYKANTWLLTEGHELVNTHLDPMWTIVADDSKIHYSGGGFCSRESNIREFGLDQQGCRDTLEQQLARFDLPPSILNPMSCFNVFMNFPYREDGTHEILVPNTKPGDKIEMRAESDILWVVSVCQYPGNCNGGKPTPLKFEVLNGAEDF